VREHRDQDQRLSQRVGAGSIKKVFDGVDNGCSGSAVENTYPYAWEDDGGAVGQFECAPSLSAIGNHTLTITPTTATTARAWRRPDDPQLHGQRADASARPTLGTPGQPYVVP
jgi:hypothetical protein